MLEQRLAGEFMHDFGHRAFHSRALTGCKNDDTELHADSLKKRPVVSGLVIIAASSCCRRGLPSLAQLLDCLDFRNGFDEFSFGASIIQIRFSILHCGFRPGFGLLCSSFVDISSTYC